MPVSKDFLAINLVMITLSSGKKVRSKPLNQIVDKLTKNSEDFTDKLPMSVKTRLKRKGSR